MAKDFSKFTERQLYNHLAKLENAMTKLRKDYQAIKVKADKLKEEKAQALKALEFLNTSTNFEQKQ
ncbi:hypothetical protein ACFOPX_08415 [Helicobacter baculiformis]|uniref:Uncharacterized protein n=1 Tax=Helicobacter baculiformis TaxID=427351 RepID=A0ABV7ZKB3_9HELI|nr:hypothetical protein [Helicobacter baculiformis]